MIVDETKTGMGATGKNWGHEHWYLKNSPCFVTFGGKSGLGGVYTSMNHRLNEEAALYP